MVYLVANKFHLQDTVRRGKTKFNDLKKRLDFRLCFYIAWILMSEKRENRSFMKRVFQLFAMPSAYDSVQTLNARFNSLSTIDNINASSFY